MKIVYFIIVLLHGLIHLMGFVKGFGIKEVKELTLPISKTAGLFWLIAAVLFIVYGILYITHHKYGWIVGLLAVVVSQILVFMFWKDAKFGTILNLIILFVSLLSLGSGLIKNKFSGHVKNDFSANNTMNTDILTEKDIAHLPALVQNYLKYTKSVGQPKVKNFRAEFAGRMRGKPEDDYMDVNSVQYNFLQKPSRYFYMEAKKMGLPATGLHVYKNETATFEVKMLNWMKVVDAQGDKMNQAETVTLFNDMCFIAPATLISPSITWESVSDSTVKGVYKNGNISISALLYFNEKGELINFISKNRYETDGKNYNNYPWATPVEDYRMINGYMLPGKAKLIYQKPEGDFMYGELDFKSVTYNLKDFED
ncbi:MAG: hypothetical protein IPL63_00435 [Saprospiraceae bacterium]|nr:hypothetical protein [Saprospiraceae bacterium]MBK8373253.1 hypothetical protein [Saprospiraceae bacterium]MBK8545900.1 hypothetical protein [Saprospiraceae bacterium]MBK8852520.1 hypothetical protein [Saprospiraceae bacterium]